MNRRANILFKGLFLLCLLCTAEFLSAQCSGVSASFSVNGTGCGIPRNYNFTNTSTGSYSSSARYIWRRGSTAVDTTTGTGTTPTISITTPGADTIWMVAIDSNGCRDSAFQIVTTTTSANAVYDPTTGTYNYSPLWQNCILFLASPDSFRIYMQSNGALSNYRVVWGDGGVDTGSSLAAYTDLSHLYTALGTYTVYIISQNGSCTDTVQGRVINERIPTAGIIGPPAGGNVGCAPHTVRFINNSSNVSSSTTFVWNMGDGTSYTLPYNTANDTIYHTYTSGLCNGVVSVQAVNACGSSTATWTPIYINDRDDANWTMTTVNCNPTLPFTFFNNSTNNYCTPSTRIFNWNFGDGTTTGWINTTTPQNHIFPRSGRYTVTLLDSNLCGVDTFRQDVIINFTPDAGFLFTNPNGCGPLTVIVTDTTDGLGNVRIWNFGNGATSGDSTDTVTYTTPGTYNLRLSVVNSCGSDMANLTVNVWAPPNASFTNITSGCSPLTVNFNNTTTYFNDSTITWRWEFGDGTDTSIKDPPSKAYTVPGTYTVWLYAYDTCGSDSMSRTFTVHPKPVAGFSADTVCYGQNTSFTDTGSVSSGTLTQYSWSFGNPAQGASSSANPGFGFSSADSFDVTQIVTTNQGCRDTLTREVVVLGIPSLSWAVSPNDSVCIGTSQTFDGTASSGSGTIQSYAWDFNNGTTSSQEDTSFIYPTAGNYAVSFTVTNSFGCVDSSLGNIVVLPLPTIAFTADTACVGGITSFQDNSTVSPGSIASRRWDLNNDGTFDSTTAVTTYVYLSLGSRYVRLEATSGFGCVNLDSNQITVHPLPVPLLSVDSSVICMGDSISLSNTSTGAVSYTYDFGDGSSLTTTSSAAIRHAYADSGVYAVKIIAYSDRSCADSNSLTVTVRPTPLAQYTVNQQVACAPFTFVFTNSSERSTDYTWFSDGNFASTAINRPDSLVSADSQAFRIALVAYNTNYSCPYDTFFLDIGTSRNPIANFVTNPDSGCGPLTVAFGNTSQYASSFYWDFRNGQSSSAQDTSMTFAAASMVDSTYMIKLYAYNWQGCADSAEKDIVVHPNPDVTFTQTNTDSCGPLTVAFTNTSTHYPGGSITDMTFIWNFGNGNTATSQDSTVQFTASQNIDSIYSVQLIGLSRYGCPDTAISTVRVYPNPVARFTESQADSCGPMTVAFTNTSYPNDTGTIANMTFNWNLGNGVSSTSQSPSTNYGASLIQDSIYSIQLIAFSEHGCLDTATNTVRVYPKPSASYTQSDTSGCGPLTVNFTNTSVPYDTSSIGDMTFIWNFGNGITSSVQDTSVRFISAASSDTVYTVTLIAYSEHGCADTFTSSVRVHPGPVAQFGVNQSIACAPFNFIFTNNSINSNNFFWAVDGVYGYNQTTRPDTLISADSQRVLITLVAETSFGCPNDTSSMVIGTSRNPIADFVTNPDSGCGPLTVAFGNTSQYASSFYWDFRNGQSSSAQDTSMTFAAASMVDSTYMIKLYAYNWQGCADSAEKDIVVHPNPDVTFTQTNTDSCGPLTVAFTNTSTHYPGGSITDMTFIWNFGNGNTATSQDSTVQFTASQNIDSIYSVQLIGLSRYGCPDTAISTVRVYPNPVARFTESQADSCGPMTVAFTNTSYPNDTGTIANMTFNWNLGNGVSSTSQSPSTNYGASLIQDSIYSIQLIAFSEHGCLDTATNTVRVYPKPSASYTQSDTSGCGPLTVNFTNTSVPYDTSSIGDMTFIWNFGNGITSSVQDTSVRFISAASSDTVYTVTLIAYSEHGCADTTTSAVRVHPKPLVALAKDDSTGCDPVIVNFTSTGVNVATYHWHFTEDDSSTIQNPSFSFRAVPFDDTTYLVKLVGESPYGCLSDTVTTTVEVLGGPYAEFYPSPDSVCATTASQMINNSRGATSYYWDFGNGDTSSVVSPQAIFSLNPSADTAYHIVMVASSGNGCRDTADAYVVVSPVPTAGFTIDIDTGCSPLAVQFTNQSVFASHYAWSYSNGQADTVANPSFSFRNSGTVDSVFTARLIVTNLGGCTDTATDYVRVYPDPGADFVITPSSGCGDLSVSFGNQSTPNDTGSIAIMSFNWNLGNGNSSTATNPSSTYIRALTQDSVYSVQLIGASEHGCLDTIQKNVRVFPKPLASFTQSDTSGCGPLTVFFFNTSIPYDTGSIADMNFQWSFGNGFTSYDRHDTVTFYPALVNDTVYTIRLIAFSEHGCRDTMYSRVRVHPDPSALFSRTPASGCGPLSVSFTGSGINVATYQWNFGNGDTGSGVSPTALFENPSDIDSVYVITLSTTSVYGCVSDSIQRTVTVRPDPAAAFTQGDDSICGTSTLVFSNASTGANSYAWNFGDGSTATNTHPQHSFAMNPTADTTYTVRLIATNFFNCRDTAFGTVTLFPFPTSIISTDTSMGCTPLTVNFGHRSLLSTGYSWNFGNGLTSTGQTPSSIFTNTTSYDTIYSVKLRVESVHGCLDSSTTNIRVFPPPTADFVAQPAAGCGDLSINFDNQSIPNDTGSIASMSFNWDLGNGNTATTEDASSLYIRSLIQDSIYTVTLIGTSEHGCLDTSIKTVRTYPKPLANFTQSDTSGCSPLIVSFTNLSLPYDTSTIADMSFHWNFGNGITSTAINPVPTFYASQIQDTIFTIRLIALSEHGCSDTTYSTVRVNPNPRLAFTNSAQAGCGPLNVQFTGNVLNVGSHYWNFGDGDTSSVANPSHAFENRPDLDTSYTVRYWAESQYGCWSDTLSTTIIVRPDPVANFSQNLDSLCGGGTIQFSNNSMLGYTYQWTFGDGSAATTAVNPQHIFTETAFIDTGYLVQLVATSVYGCRDTLIKPTTIFPLPDAQITFSPDSGCSPLLVQFGNTSTIAASHSWSFGDNTTATGDTLSHLFVNQLGINQDFQVIQEAITAHGCIDRDTVSIRVHPLPRPNFVFTKTGICDTSEYNFTNISAGALLYEWDFGDGTGSFVDNPSHIFPNALNSDTTFITLLTATTNYGCVDSVSKTVSVTPILIAQAATLGAMGCPPLAVNFVNNSRNATNFYWDFNDGFVSTASSPSHTFINSNLTPEVYNVQLIVSNAFGCADTAIVPVRVLPNISAGFIASKTPVCDIAEYTFTNLSVGAVNYAWHFGDGSISAASSPVHTFPTSLIQDTTFTIRLVSSSSYGCFDTAYRTINVHPIVTALFTLDNLEACGFMLAQFTNLSTNGNYHVWDFGDGSGSAQFSPSHPYGQIGTYYPSIEVFDAYGCSASYTLPNPIIIWEIPLANFVALPTTQRLPNSTFNFTNLSIAIDPLNYVWNFGEPASGANNSSTIQDPQHTYADSGTYIIQLIITNGHCWDTIIRSVRVEYYFPIASFRQNPDTGCMEHTVVFSNESQYANSYRWFFGDGGQSTEENPTHTYINPGIYTVTLIAYGAGGVDDSTKIDQIVVIQKPYANFYTTPTVAWLPNTSIQFVNISLLATSYIWDIFAPIGPDLSSTEEAPLIELTEEGDYTIRLIAINDYGCRDTAYKENYIRINAGGVLLVPDAFTPNGDGINDNFKPVFEGVEREGYTFRVYNRWGELLFETHDVDEAWDGTFHGVMSESEVYVWQVQGHYYGTDHFQERGRIMLLR